jgi:hypothetical protein
VQWQGWQGRFAVAASVWRDMLDFGNNVSSVDDGLQAGIN